MTGAHYALSGRRLERRENCNALCGYQLHLRPESLVTRRGYNISIHGNLHLHGLALLAFTLVKYLGHTVPLGLSERSRGDASSSQIISKKKGARDTETLCGWKGLAVMCLSLCSSERSWMYFVNHVGFEQLSPPERCDNARWYIFQDNRALCN